MIYLKLAEYANNILASMLISTGAYVLGVSI